VYFAPEARERYEALGLDYIPGYFCSRSACLGEAPWTVVCAAFAAFKPAVVQEAVTTGWAKTDPESMLGARLEGATAQLTRLLGEPDSQIERATEILSSLTDGVDPSGRALYAGLSALPQPESPMGRLWRAADLVREHRGDGHIAAWISRLDSCALTTITELWWGIEPGSYVFTRGWSTDDVDAARERLRERGLIDADGAITTAGHELREAIEEDTDRAEYQVIDRLDDRADELFDLLTPIATTIVEGGGYPASVSRLFDTPG
jgi:hypothetical protein